MPKTEKLHFKHGNLITVKPPRDLLEVGSFTLDFDVAGVDSSRDLEIAGMAVIKEYQRRLNEDLKKLIDKLTSLQQEEKVGKNAKASEEAKKLVDQTNEEFKDAVDDIRIDVRAVIKKKTGEETQTIGNVTFKGMRLVRGAFTGNVGDEKFVSFFKKLGKTLAEQTSEIIGKQATAEEKERKALVQDVQDALNDLKRGDTRADTGRKDGRKEMRDLQGRCKSYTDQLTAGREALDKMAKEFKQLDKLLREQKEPAGGEKMKVLTKFTGAADELTDDLAGRAELVGDVSTMFDEPPRGWTQTLQEIALTKAAMKLKGLPDFNTKGLSDSAKALLVLAKKA